jgi:two-component system, chemotaxis family, chemotaxis protein CheY
MPLGRILVVDDEEAVRKPVSLQLRKAGYEVLEASDGQEVLSLLETGRTPGLKLILLDIRMPHINGMDLLAHMRPQAPTVPIVILTGLPDMQFARSLLKHGVVKYLIKPVSKEQLLEAVREAIGQKTLSV